MGAHLTVLVTQAMMTAILFAAGWAMMRAIGKGSEARRVHGRYVFWWAVSGYMVGAVICVVAGTNDGGVAYLTGGLLLLGWLIGTLHGGVVLLNRYTSGRTPSGQPSDTMAF